MLLALALACSSSVDAPQRTEILIVRHAEKDTSVEKDPPLTPAGEARAEALAKRLVDVELVSVHSTDTLRTRSTVAPTARAHGLALQLYDPREPDALVALLKEPGVHLVVGHSNTVPGLVEKLGGKPGGEIDEKYEYDRLYSIVMQGEEAPVTVLQRYGAASVIPKPVPEPDVEPVEPVAPAP